MSTSTQPTTYDAAIAWRQDRIKELQNNPPVKWLPEYTKKTIDIIQQQIDLLKQDTY
jgi:hypothetical protein